MTLLDGRTIVAVENSPAGQRSCVRLDRGRIVESNIRGKTALN